MAKKGLTFRRTITTGSLEVVTTLVAMGAGVGILPGRVATRDAKLGLRPLTGAPRFQDRICLAYRADAHKSAASKVIIAAMTACL
jgi:DNA-binding transcriptional LysR family regulator